MASARLPLIPKTPGYVINLRALELIQLFGDVPLENTRPYALVS